ncbi:hypothetical protein LMG29542_04076 [Paraburkholderia humisilvae]|uniref:Uncharacterized protein n=2 Tax=Paraburkholderia humisilvae TaxID=627669 RepID=A0A6J5E4R8_9BURK|nr:hypothetical protein LMG29542_04076 [Paraburkholderia humisilvae]
MLHKAYCKELHRALGYFGTWLPSMQLRLGDILTVEGETARPVGHVSEHRLTFTPRRSTPEGVIEYSSASGVTISTKIAGQTLPGSMLTEAEAGVVVKFARANAIVFEAAGCDVTRIADLTQLGNQIKKLYLAGEWQRDWIVVTELVKADSATIIVSAGASAQADLKANGSVQIGATRLTDLGLKLEAKYTSGLAFKTVASASLTPLYRANGLKRSWFDPEFRFRDRPDLGPKETHEFAPLSPDDVWTGVDPSGMQ